MIEVLIDEAVLGLMLIIAVGVLYQRNLFAAAMLTSIYSLLAAALFVVMDAVDVAFTEASVGAGISIILALGALALTCGEQKARPVFALGPFLLVLLTGAVLIYGTSDMPAYGDASAPIHRHVAPRYLEDSRGEVGPPNVVTSVLASYRGYDTLGETVVIFTAGVGVLALLGRRRRKAAKPAEEEA